MRNYFINKTYSLKPQFFLFQLIILFIYGIVIYTFILVSSICNNYNFPLIFLIKIMGNCSCQSVSKSPNTQLITETDVLTQSTNKQNIIRQQKKEIEDKIKEAKKKNQLKPYQNLRSVSKKKNLIGIEDEEKKIYQNVKITQKETSLADTPLIINAFDKHFLFSQLNTQFKSEISLKMRLCTTQANNYVFKQGDKATAYFIIKLGQCQLIIDNKVKKKIKKGQSFGDLALLYGAKRSASIKTITNCQFWMIDRKSFKQAVQQINQKNQNQNRQILKAVSFFQMLTAQQQLSVLNSIVTLTYQKDEQIICKGDQANSFYIIKSGKAGIIRQDGTQVILGSKDSFGQKSLQSQITKRSATVRAIQKCQVISIGKDTIINVLGEGITDVLNHNQIKRAFQKSSYFNSFNAQKTSELISKAKIISKNKNDIIIKAGQKIDKIYVTLRLKATKQSSKDFFYEQYSIIQQQAFLKQKILSKNIIATSDGQIAQIQYIIQQLVPKQQKSDSLKFVKQHIIDINSITLNNLMLIKTLGFGQFGQIYSVYSPQYRKTFALKTLNKANIQKNKLSKHLIYQQTVLKMLQNQFIMKYYKTLKDQYNVYFLLEFINGKQLFEVIREIGILNLNQARFYTSQIILALQFFHGNNIIYRDLKPENIMVAKDGYIKLIDVGTAKILKKQNKFRTNTVIGTPHYMAPETVSGKGYSFMTDLWSLGVCLYEFVCGRLPFCQQSQDPYQIYQQIIKKSIIFPIFLKDKRIKKFIQKLLSKIPQARLGISYENLKRQDFFKDFNWLQLKQKKMIPQYKLNTTYQELDQFQKSNKKTVKKYFESQKKNQKESVTIKIYEWQKMLET